MSGKRNLARIFARRWWAHYPEKHSAICDRCNGTLKRDEGCLVAGTFGADMVCESCFNPETHDPLDFDAFRARLQGKSPEEISAEAFGRSPLGIAVIVVACVLFYGGIGWIIWRSLAG